MPSSLSPLAAEDGRLLSLPSLKCVSFFLLEEKKNSRTNRIGPQSQVFFFFFSLTPGHSSLSLVLFYSPSLKNGVRLPTSAQGLEKTGIPGKGTMLRF